MGVRVASILFIAACGIKEKEFPLKKLIVLAAVAILGAVAIAAEPTNNPDGCMLGNGGSDPICTPSIGPGGK